MRIRTALSLLLVLTARLIVAQSVVLKIDPWCPVAGGEDEGTKEIRLTYYPQTPAAKLKNAQKLELQVGVNGRFWRDNTRAVPFVRNNDGTWQAVLTHKNNHDVWFYLVFQVVDPATHEIDDNSGHYWDAVACNSDGSVNESGVRSRAESYTGARFDNGIGRQQDYGKAVAVLDDFRKADPQAGAGLLTFYWDYKVRLNGNDDAAYKKIAAEISRFIDDHRLDEDELRGTFYYVLNHETRLPSELYPRLMRYMEGVDPEEAARLERTTMLNRLRREKDTRKKADGLVEFLRKYPTDRQAPNAAVECFMAMRSLHDIAGAEAIFKTLLGFDPERGDTYATMAAIYLENDQKPEESLTLLDKAEQLGPPKPGDVQTFNIFLTFSPDESNTAATLSYWRARAYLLQGKGELALPLAQRAVADHRTSERYFLLAQAYEAVDQKDKAVDAYLEALAHSSTQSATEKERLEKLWLSGGFGTKGQLEERLKKQADDAFRNANYVPKLVDEPVREYEFTTLKGEKFRSVDLADKTVILNFWGTWCSPCLPELTEFEQLQQRHPELVVAALAISSERKEIERVIANEKLDTLRIAQADALGDVFLNQGVPVTYVIEHGRIRVIHRQPLSNVVSYIEADLASLKDRAKAPGEASGSLSQQAH